MNTKKPSPQGEEKTKKTPKTEKAKKSQTKPEKEVGGYEDAGLAEPTRFGDWEVKGRCSDF